MKEALKVLMAVGLFSLAFSYIGNAQTANAASPGPFTCDSNFYQVISGQLKQLNPVSGLYTNIGTNSGIYYNAIGYNVVDNYIYGIQQTAGNGGSIGDLLKIANNGTYTDLGLPAGLPAAVYFTGDFDADGNLYILGGSNTIYEVHVNGTSSTTTTITTTGDAIVAASDLVVMGSDATGYTMYLLQDDTLSVVNLTTDTVVNSTVTGPSGWLTAGPDFGAAWADGSGNLFFSNNDSGSIYQITGYNTPNPTAIFKVTGTVTNINDGANCHLSLENPFDPPVAANDSYNVPFDGSLSEVITPVLANDTGNALTVTSNTDAAHGSLLLNSDGTFTYIPDTGFSGLDSFTYTVTDNVGRTSTATVTIDVAAPTPNTGDGAPPDSAPLIIVTALSVVAIAAGLLLLCRPNERISR